MAQHGGSFENYYYRDQVTHVICSNLTDQKIKLFHKERCASQSAALLQHQNSSSAPRSCAKIHVLQHHRLPTPIIRPEWIVDSLKANKLLPVSAFASQQALSYPSASHMQARKSYSALDLHTCTQSYLG